MEYGEEDSDDRFIRYSLRNVSMVNVTQRSPTFLTLGMPGVQTWRIENFFKCGGYNVTTWRCQYHEMSCGSCIPEDSDDFLVSHLPACKPLMNESEVDWWARNGFKPRKRDLCVFPEVSDYIKLFDYFPNTKFILEYDSPWNWIETIKQGQNSLRELIVGCDYPELRPKEYDTESEETDSEVTDYDLIQWYHAHYLSIKEEIKRRNESGRAVNFVFVNMGENETDTVLSDMVPTIPPSCWIPAPKNRSLDPTDQNSWYENDVNYYATRGDDKTSRALRITLIAVGGTFTFCLLVFCFGKGLQRVFLPTQSNRGYKRPTYQRNRLSFPPLPSLTNQEGSSSVPRHSVREETARLVVNEDDEHYYGSDEDEHPHGL